MKDLKNKKLLVLSGGYLSVPVVERAKELGMYVIVTDFYEDWKDSPAKSVADEGWNISWNDIETLKEKCREYKVDAVVTGFSEFAVKAMIDLCKALNLPCYINYEQLDITSDKKLFKKTCKQYGLPTVPEYKLLEDALDAEEYPYIVKPVDRAGTIGIKVAYTEKELKENFDYAMELSPSKSVIIEKYMAGCCKVDLYYMINSGEIRLLSPSDSFMCEKFGHEKIVQNGWIHPTRHFNAIKPEIEEKIYGFIKGIGVENGYMFISTFVDENDKMYIFECGYRLCGGVTFLYSALNHNYNYLDHFLEYAVYGECDLDNFGSIDARRQKNISVAINFYVKADNIIAKIEGIEEARELPYVIGSFKCVPEGTVGTNEGALLTKAAMVILYLEEGADKKEAVKKIYDIVKITNDKGENIIIDYIDMEEL